MILGTFSFNLLQIAKKLSLIRIKQKILFPTVASRFKREQRRIQSFAIHPG